jgi:hypothetical protein
MPPEADITINGQRLTTAQALTVRCALDAFAALLRQYGLGEEPQHQRLTQAYLARLQELAGLIGAPLTQEDRR